MRVYHFVNEKFGLENILRRRLKIARINELNDPFEFLATEASNATVRRAFLAVKVQQAISTGILCFSEAWTNPVQWSHYANHHQGICMGFDVPDNQLKAVSYVRERLLLDWPKMQSDPAFGEEFMSQVISTKFEHWSYEQEMRSFVRLDPATEENGLFFMDFSPDIRLSEIIVGHCSPITRNQLKDVLGNLASEVRCLKARLAFKTFEVTEQKLGSIWR